MTLLVGLRLTGIVLAAGLIVALVQATLKGNISLGRALATATSIAVPGLVVAWLIFPLLTGVHLDQPGLTLPQLVLENLRLRTSDLGRVTVPGMFKAYGPPRTWFDINMVVYIPVTLLVAIGWWRHVNRDRDLLLLSFPFYFALYVALPFDSGARYLIPALPMILACVWLAVQGWPVSRTRLFAALLAAHLVAAAGHWTAVEIPEGRRQQSYWIVANRLIDRIGGGDLAGSGGTGTIITRDIPPSLGLMLQLLLDRQVAEQRPGTPLPADARWIFTGSRVPPEGFEIRSTFGDYCLLERRVPR